MALHGDRQSEQVFFLDLGEDRVRLNSVFNHKSYHEIIKEKGLANEEVRPLSCPTWGITEGTAKQLLFGKWRLRPGSLVLLVQPGRSFLRQLAKRAENEGGGQGMEVEAQEGAGKEAPGEAVREDVPGAEATGMDATASGPEAAAEWRRCYGGLQVIVGVARVAAVRHEPERCMQQFFQQNIKNRGNKFTHLVEFEDVVPVALPLVQLAYDLEHLNKEGKPKILRGMCLQPKKMAKPAFDYYVAAGEELLKLARAHRLATAESVSAAQQTLQPLPSPAAAFPPFPGGGYLGFLRQKEKGQGAGEGQGHVGALEREEEEDGLGLGRPIEHPERTAEGRASGGAHTGGDGSDDGESFGDGSTDDSGNGGGALEDMDGGDDADSDDFGGGGGNGGDSGGSGGGGRPRRPSGDLGPAGTSRAAWGEGTATPGGLHGGYVGAEEASHESDTNTGAGGGTGAGVGAATDAPHHSRKRRSEGATPPAQRQRQADDARRPSSVGRVPGPSHPASPATAVSAAGAEHACPGLAGVLPNGGTGDGPALQAAASAPERTEGMGALPQQTRQSAQSPSPTPAAKGSDYGDGGSSGGSGSGGNGGGISMKAVGAQPGPMQGALAVGRVPALRHVGPVSVAEVGPMSAGAEERPAHVSNAPCRQRTGPQAANFSLRRQMQVYAANALLYYQHCQRLQARGQLPDLPGASSAASLSLSQGQSRPPQQQHSGPRASGGHGGAGLGRTAFAAAGTSSAAGAAAAADARASGGAAAAVQGPSAQRAAAGPSGAAAAVAPPAEPPPALAERPQEALEEDADIVQQLQAVQRGIMHRLQASRQEAAAAVARAEAATKKLVARELEIELQRQRLTAALAEEQAAAKAARQRVVELESWVRERAEAERVAAELRGRIDVLTAERDAARAEAAEQQRAAEARAAELTAERDAAAAAAEVYAAANAAVAALTAERDAARAEAAQQQEAAQRLNERITELEAAVDITRKQREDELLEIVAQVQSALAKKQR